jgi:hypothetical protein
MLEIVEQCDRQIGDFFDEKPPVDDWCSICHVDMKGSMRKLFTRLMVTLPPSFIQF